MNKGKLFVIALVLVLIGALNWGLVGLFDIDLVQKLFRTSLISRLIYVLVGVSAAYVLYVDGRNLGLYWSSS
jgi:uncharacterized membrane protein YuzA (DUF378 family)